MFIFKIVQEDLAAHLESAILNYDRYDANRLMRPQSTPN